MKSSPASSIPAYIKTFPKDVQQALTQVYKTVKTAAPKAEESISYGMPAFKLNGKPLVYFAGWKTHVGFYATPSGNVAFKKDLAKYKQAKGSVQFPLTEAMPLGLIRRMVQYRVKENNAAYK